MGDVTGLHHAESARRDVAVCALPRLRGWEGRLANAIEAARARPYVLGEADCFRMACEAVQALVGVDLWAEHRGTYSTREEAQARVLAYGATFTRAFCNIFGAEPWAMAMGRRGDIAEYRDPGGEAHLGVVVGAAVAVAGQRGLLFLKRSECRHCWGIG